MTDDATPAPPAAAGPTIPAHLSKPPANTKGGVIGVLVVAAVVAFCVWGHKGSSGSSEDDRSNAAISACESSVKDELKSPSSAKFSDERYTDNDPSWLATGDVDSQNSFGAMIRSHFVCNLSRAGDTFTVVSTSVV